VDAVTNPPKSETDASTTCVVVQVEPVALEEPNATAGTLAG